MSASYFGRVDVIDVLLKANADVNMVDENVGTARQKRVSGIYNIIFTVDTYPDTVSWRKHFIVSVIIKRCGNRARNL